jgi:hypothetical protein
MVDVSRRGRGGQQDGVDGLDDDLGVCRADGAGDHPAARVDDRDAAPGLGDSWDV